jgi:hypothetical protein
VVNSDFHVNFRIFYMLQIYDIGPTALLPLRRKARWGFFRHKNPTASAGFEPASFHRDNVEKYCRAGQATDENLCMCIVCSITESTNVHWEYVILISFPQQRWLHERPSPLRYTYGYMACLVYIYIFLQQVIAGESNGKLPPRTCPGCSVPEPYRSHAWALVPANPASKAEY